MLVQDSGENRSDPLLGCLKATFGYDAFRPGQRALIEAGLRRSDAIGILPTGAGKSLVYQLPALLAGGTALVVSPLIALMKDQVDALELLGVSATYLNSSLEPSERAKRLAELRAGRYRLVYLAPEGLGASAGAAIAQLPLSLIAVDEAHCISSWGHDFRPAYRALTGLKARFGKVPILALTATATRTVEDDIVAQLAMENPVRVRSSFFRSNLQLSVYRKGEGEAAVRESLLRLALARRGSAGIVYCLSRQSVETTAAYLRDQGVAARAYHAGLATGERSQVQEDFRRDRVEVVVATVAFGMGIDKSNVRYVLHRDLPRSLESYYQEIGRAGRDGEPADCVLFYSWADVLNFDRFQSGQPPEVAERNRGLARGVYRFAEGRGCRHQALVRYLGEQRGPCGTSCDHCNGRDALRDAPPVPPRRKRGLSAGPNTNQSGQALTATRPDRASGIRPDYDEHLFLKLKTLRRELADAQDVPAYLVFNDATLAAMARLRPASAPDLLAIAGVGPKKLLQYGERFLRCLREAGPPPALASPTSATESSKPPAALTDHRTGA